MNITIPKIHGLGITNQRETTIAFDANSGEALCNAIVWSDTRTSHIVDKFCKEITEKGLVSEGTDAKDCFKSVTGLPISTYFSAFKIKWLVENNARVAEAVKSGTARFCNINTWLIYKLTNRSQFLTDVSNASRMFLMDLKTLSYSETLLEIF
jgi:glycerol kinase